MARQYAEVSVRTVPLTSLKVVPKSVERRMEFCKTGIVIVVQPENTALSELFAFAVESRNPVTVPG
jgi:hypothetical protein